MQSSPIQFLDIVGNQIRTDNNMSYPDYVEVQWNRRWNAPGDFTVYMPFDYSCYCEAMAVKLEGRPEVGLITKREITVGTEGTFLTFSGLFAEGILKWGSHLTQLSITASNWPTQLAKLIAETLTSHSDANRTHISGLAEEGKVQRTGQSAQYYPIVMHCEVGPIQSKAASSHSFPATTLTGDEDVCDWIYSIMPSTCSLRAHLFTKVDSSNPDIPSNLLPGGRGEFTKSDLANIYPVYIRYTDNSTPALAVGWEVLDANRTPAVTFDNNNTYEMHLVIDESNAHPVSRAYFDDALVWWNNTYPVTRSTTRPGDEGTVYRAEEMYFNDSQMPGYWNVVNRYAGGWGFGRCFPNCAGSSEVTCEMEAGNRATIYSEINNGAKLNSLNFRRDEQIEIKPAQVPGTEYMTNYDIGDYVNIRMTAPNRGGGVTQPIADFTAQIIEINEVHTENHIDFSIVVGSLKVL